jgi:hypothetical protein
MSFSRADIKHGNHFEGKQYSFTLKIINNEQNNQSEYQPE